MEENLKRKEKETYLQYVKRLTENKKVYDLDYTEYGDLILGDENNYSSENIRKGFYLIDKIFKKADLDNENEIINKCEDKNEALIELEMKKIELKEERKKIGLIRSELNKLINEKVKYDNLIEIFDKVIKENNLPRFEYIEKENYIESENEMIAVLSDCHYGMTIDNEFEKYNSDIFAERLYKYYDKIIKIKNKDNINICNLAILGDLISGIIHNTLRIENSENMIEQIQGISEILSEFIYKLSKEFNLIKIYYVTGNHSRNFQDKKQELIGERLENLILWYLKARLDILPNIGFINSIADNTISKVSICGKTCVFVHGDNDNVNNVIPKMTNMFNEKIDLVLMAHYHNFNVSKQGKSLVVTNGAFLCNDEYCLNKRLVGEPSQTVIILNNEEIDNIYDVKLN